jgi:hypothetical protein
MTGRALGKGMPVEADDLLSSARFSSTLFSSVLLSPGLLAWTLSWSRLA